MATRARDVSKSDEAGQVLQSAAGGAVGGAVKGGLLGAVGGFMLGVLSMALPALVIGAATGFLSSFIPGINGIKTGLLFSGITAGFGGIVGAAGATSLVAGLGALFGGVKGGLGAEAKVEQQRELFALQKDAGKRTAEAFVSKGRQDAIKEFGPQYYQQGALEMAQVAQAQMEPILTEAYNKGALDTAKAFKEKLGANKTGGLETPAEAKGAGNLQTTGGAGIQHVPAGAAKDGAPAAHPGMNKGLGDHPQATMSAVSISNGVQAGATLGAS